MICRLLRYLGITDRWTGCAHRGRGITFLTLKSIAYCVRGGAIASANVRKVGRLAPMICNQRSALKFENELHLDTED